MTVTVDPLAVAERELRSGELRPARDRLARLLPQLEHADPARFRRAVNMLGAAYFELGELEPAEAAFGQALELANEAADSLTVARATNNLGLIANIRGRREEALTRYRLAVPAYQRIGNSPGLAETCHNLAITFRDLGQLEQADRYQRRAIEYAREAGNQRLLAMTQVGRAELALRRGEAAVAEAGARLGAEQYARIPDALGEADALRLVGAARLARGTPEAARDPLDRAVTQARLHGSALLEAEALETRARLLAEQGDWCGAREDARNSIALFERLGDVRGPELARWLATLPER